MQPSKIVKRYLKGDFMIDFLSTFPFRMLKISNAYFKTFAAMCQLLKVLRIRKLYQIIGQANLKVEQKAFCKIGFYSFLIVVYTHIVGCMMWYLMKTDYIWVAPTDFGNIRSRVQDPWQLGNYVGNTQNIVENRTDRDLFFFQWGYMWYHSALSLMLVEVTARSEMQILGMIFIYIINAIFNAILFGIYFDLLEQARRRDNFL